jgi:hypothetical protein
MEQPRDRHAGLIVFGVLQILIGLICAAFTLFVAAAMGTGQMPQGASMAPALVVYALGAVYFISVGIGSVRARRWARALSVVVSAMATVAGAIATLMLVVMLPQLREIIPVGSAGAVSGCAIGFVVVAGVLIPLGLFLFYRSHDVRTTCERRDPTPRWTDRVPLPVLAVVVVMAFAAVTLVASLSNPVLPLFGSVITGAPAALTFLSLSFLSAFLAVQLYRLKESAWWTLVLMQVTGCVIGALTITRMDTRVVPQAAGTPDITAIYRNPLFIALLIATWVGYFAFLLSLKRYFGKIVPRTRAGD